MRNVTDMADIFVQNKLEGWGKKPGRIHSFAESSIVLGKFEQLM